MTLDVHFENKIEKVHVPLNMELPELLKSLKERTGCSEVAKLEQFDEDFQAWLAINEKEELNIYSGAELKITRRL